VKVQATITKYKTNGTKLNTNLQAKLKEYQTIKAQFTELNKENVAKAEREKKLAFGKAS
jgi:hypothetical protein